jgi:hypothetical protein
MKEMKKLLILNWLFLMTIFGYSQTVAEKPEFIKFMNYCQTPIEVQCHMIGEVSLVKFNVNYADPITYYKDSLNNWMAKYPLVVKWYAISNRNTTTEAYQQEVIAYFKVNVARVYCTSKTKYLALFRAHWKNGDMQSGWFDSHYLPMTVKF